MAEIIFNRDHEGNITSVERRLSESEKSDIDKIIKSRWEILERSDLMPLSLRDAFKVLKILHNGSSKVPDRFLMLKARGLIKAGVTVE